MDSEFLEKLEREEVIVVTGHNLIRGSLCRHQEIRFSDTLNAPANQGTPYLSLVNAVVMRIETGRRIFTARFLLIARSTIEVILPASDIEIDHVSELPVPPAGFRGKWVNAQQLMEGIAPLIHAAQGDSSQPS